MNVKIDDDTFKADLFLVEDHLLPADMLLGTDLICQSGNKLVIHEGICYLKSSNVNKTTITPEVSQLIDRYGAAFSDNLADVGVCKTVEMNIDLLSNKPIARRPYRIPFAKRPVIDKIMKELLETNIIKPSVICVTDCFGEEVQRRRSNVYRLSRAERSHNKATFFHASN